MASSVIVALPAKLQNEIKQYQRIQQDLAQMDQQRLQLDLKLREVTHTLEELKTLPPESAVYRPIGALMVKAKDHQEVLDILTEEKETLEVRLKSTERQENSLKERYTTMQREITEELQAANVAAAASATRPAPGPG
jgi:prefoldin beta subunit